MGLVDRAFAVRTLLFVLGLSFLPSVVHAAPYRDKHGNAGNINLSPPVVNYAATGIDYAVPYTLTDSVGPTSGEYVITSSFAPGRDPGSDDFVLSVFVVDNPTQRAAELVFRNNANVAPLAPTVRLLDCASGTCTEMARYDNEIWGAWVIQDQGHIADYPIELLDSRVITQLLDPSQLSQVPNTTDGTGNWAEIMENHRTNFEEARFRADIDNLGDAQSALLTSRMIGEITAELGTPDDWLVRHYPTIAHGALTFMTEHRALIEDMTTTLHNNYTWPLDFSFPFGRMPIWLVDPHLDAGPDSPGPDPIHALPMHWDQVIPSQAPLGTPGCWHDFPAEAYVPTLTNGATNIGQYECAPVATSSGFVDRPCTQPTDYTNAGLGGSSLLSDVEGAWHNPIHGFIGGSFSPPATTAGTMVFWVFHTYASTNTLANWRQAQRRSMDTPYHVAEASLNQIVGTATALPSPIGNVEVTGVFNPPTPIDLSTATITIDRLLSEAGAELVSAVPMTLSPVPGSTATAATYVSPVFPTVSVSIIQLPLIGYVTQVVVATTSVTKPASCGLFFGFANLETQFTLSDGTNPDLLVSGSNLWSCAFVELISL